jgi:glycosyltransferase involved in cell wall biosynthesis
MAAAFRRRPRTHAVKGPMMKLIIQIPCYNEEATLARALAELPREVDGFEKVEWLIINDGSTDNTVAVAKASGVDHVVSFTKNQGLARGFLAGLDACVSLGADVIVNTDADNQYNAGDIPALVEPVLNGEADLVIGARPISTIRHFSPVKKLLQKLGSWAVRRASKTRVQDAPSGFRAISRDAAMQLNVFNSYTYTIETIIQAGQKNMAVTNVPVQVNEDLRPSKLVKSIFSYVKRSIGTIIRILITYRPFSFFMSAGLVLFAGGFAIGARYVYFVIIGEGGGHVQSLILASILLGIGFQTMLVAFIADLISVNRKLMEDVQYRVRRIEQGSPKDRGTGSADGRK